MKATIVITTKDRWEDLKIALASCAIQKEDPEVIVVDDGSTDATKDSVQALFPSVRYIRHETSRGCIVRRNEAAELATGDVIFSIDDDAEFSTPNVVAQTLLDFDHPRIAAVAIPLFEPNHNNLESFRAPDGNHRWITDSFKGTSYAIKRKAFRSTGGFRSHLVHQGEEGDLCIRLINNGQVVRIGRSDPIIHYESPKRDLSRMHYFGRRNDMLFAIENTPLDRLPFHLAGTTINGIRTAMITPNSIPMYRGIAVGWLEVFRRFGGRRPVTTKCYDLFRDLRKTGPQKLDQLELRLPPLCVGALPA